METSAWDSARRAAKTSARIVLRTLPESTRVSVRQRLGRAHPADEGVVLPPPPCAPGMITGPPDYVGVGSQRSGTTWWCALLRQQGLIFDAPGLPKERHFFNRFCIREFESASAEEYHRWFPHPPGRISGEWTPDYMYHFWIPPLLARAAPNAKLLVLVRDPVERYRSGLTLYFRQHQVMRYGEPDEAFARGLYAEQLIRLREAFPAGQILVLQYERCCLEPAREFARTLEFLGLGPACPGTSFDRRVNVTTMGKAPLPGPVRDELVARYAVDLRRLFDLYPGLEPSLWPTALEVL